MNNLTFSCSAHRLLCLEHSGGTEAALADDLAYDPFDGIPGAAEALAALTKSATSVEFLGSHETNWPHCDDFTLVLVDHSELHDDKRAAPNSFFYVFDSAHGDAQPAYCIFYVAPAGEGRIVVRVDVQIDDVEAPSFTEYLLCCE